MFLTIVIIVWGAYQSSRFEPCVNSEGSKSEKEKMNVVVNGL